MLNIHMDTFHTIMLLGTIFSILQMRTKAQKCKKLAKSHIVGKS